MLVPHDSESIYASDKITTDKKHENNMPNNGPLPSTWPSISPLPTKYIGLKDHKNDFSDYAMLGFVVPLMAMVFIVLLPFVLVGWLVTRVYTDILKQKGTL